MVDANQSLEAIGGQIKYWRKTVRGLTLQALADLVGVTPGALSKLENAVEGVSLPVFERIAKALNVPLTVLIDPKVQFAVLGGTLTAPGLWSEQFPIVEAATASLVLLPHAVDAGAAFIHDLEILFCGEQIQTAPFAPKPGILKPDHRYVVLRRVEFDGVAYYEMALRVFRKPSPEMTNALSRAGAFAAPARNALSIAGDQIAANELTRAATTGTPVSKRKKPGPLTAALLAGGPDSPGWFWGEVPADADPRFAHPMVMGHDPSILCVWPLRAAFQCYPKG